MYGSYPKKVYNSIQAEDGHQTAKALEASTGAILTVLMEEPFLVNRFGFRVTVEFDYDTQTAEGILTLYRYPVAAGTNKVALATIPLSDGCLAENIYYVDVANPPVAARKMGRAEILAGEYVVIEITTQAAGGGYIAGDFQPFFAGHHKAEVAANQSKMHDYNVYNTITS